MERERAGDGEVVVAGQANRGVPPGELAAGIGLGSVADEVAEAPDLLRIRSGDVGEHRLESVAVAVDVGDDRDLHGRLSIAYERRTE